MHKGLALLFLLSSLAIVVLVIVSLSTDSWLIYDPPNEDYTNLVSSGLWRYCRLNGCVSINEYEASDLLKTVRGFLFLTMFAGLAAAFFAGRLLVEKEDNQLFLHIMFLCAVVFMFLGMIIYTSDSGNSVPVIPGGSWGYSFIIGWLTVVLAFVVFCLSIFIEPNFDSKEQLNIQA